jgi:adenosylcobinamide-GDP ribazoletransferase
VGFVRGLHVALTLLTRLPLATRGSDPEALAASVPWFPVVGALVGLSVSVLYVMAAAVGPALVAAPIAVIGGVLLTGALHEDGLGDVADAMGGGWTRDQRLRIMRDPRHGTHGVIAVVGSLLIRSAALSSLSGWSAVAALVGTHALGRGAVVLLLGSVPPATEEGLGAAFGRLVTPRVAIVGLASSTLIAFASMGLGATLGIAVAVAATGVVALLAVRAFGGITGDVLGATEQVAEILVLGSATVLTWNGVPVPWW